MAISVRIYMGVKYCSRGKVDRGLSFWVAMARRRLPCSPCHLSIHFFTVMLSRGLSLADDSQCICVDEHLEGIKYEMKHAKVDRRPRGPFGYGNVLLGVCV